MAIDVATFRVRFPEFASPKAADASIEIQLGDAQNTISRGKLPNTPQGTNIYERMIFNLAAHEIQIGLDTELGDVLSKGAVTSHSVRQVSASYARAASSGAVEDYYLTTVYGQRYWQLLVVHCAGILTV